MRLFGVHLIGFSRENLHKLLLTVAFVAGILLVRALVLGAMRLFLHRNERVVFWTRQGTGLVAAVLSVLAVVSIWFDDPTRMALPFGLVSAGLAFALQKVITSLAGYLVILRGKTFSVGDRIAMGGVRGDVIALGFIQTTILEMGQPTGDASDAPRTWVHARQYTGRVVTVTNDKLFDNPVYNYSREFPFLWEEIAIPISYGSDRHKAEQIILDAARAATEHLNRMSREEREELQNRYFVELDDMVPRVFYRLTDNWIELSLRFFARPHGARVLKDDIARRILDGLEREGIGIASGTYDIVGLPPLKLDAKTIDKLASALRANDRNSRISLS